MTARGLRAPAFQVEDGIASARALFASALANGAARDLDAIVCASDALAVGAHLAAVDAGVTGVAVIGFDNTPFVEALGISSIEQSPELVAEATLDLLTDASGKRVASAGTEARHVLVQPRLVVRDGATGRALA